MEDDRVWDFERTLWMGGRAEYQAGVDPDCQMVTPQAPHLMTGQQAIDACSDTPRWSAVDFADGRISRPMEGMIVVAYHVTARGGDQDAEYKAWCTSTYRRRAHDDWTVVQHQQTPPLAVGHDAGDASAGTSGTSGSADGTPRASADGSGGGGGGPALNAAPSAPVSGAAASEDGRGGQAGYGNVG